MPEMSMTTLAHLLCVLRNLTSGSFTEALHNRFSPQEPHERLRVYHTVRTRSEPDLSPMNRETRGALCLMGQLFVTDLNLSQHASLTRCMEY